MRRIFFVAALAITVTACLTQMNDDDGEVTIGGTTGSGGGSGSDASVLALVVPTPRDHNLEYIVGLSSMAVVIAPGLRRKRRHDATRAA